VSEPDTESKPRSVTVSYTIKPEQYRQMTEDLLVTAFEGGIGYWAQLQGYKLPAKYKKLDLPKYAYIPMLPGGAVVIKDSEGKLHRVGAKRLERAYQTVARDYPKVFQRILDEQYDAWDADVWFQCAVFGELVYG
jgi:hypothetical protein